ncbi:MAG: hypothetical protein ACK4K9_01635 [Bacteroidia bacterium]
MRDNFENNTYLINRLTALWAFSECGLGSLIHAFKIPFSGFFLGGFAIIVVNLLAQHTHSPFKTIAQSTIQVLLVKAAVSPHTPWPAYVAVSFQGFLGATVYQFFRSNLITNAFYAVVALVESAMQKIIITTLIFGKSIWQALDVFFTGILKDFGIKSQVSFSYWIIGFYVGIYVVWGFILAVLMLKIPQKIKTNKEKVLTEFLKIKPVSVQDGKNKNILLLRVIGFMFLLIFVMGMLVIYKNANPWYVLTRTIVAILILYGIVSPFFKWLIKRLNRKNKNNTKLTQIILQIPEFKSFATIALQLSFAKERSLRASANFILYMIILSLYAGKTADEE